MHIFHKWRYFILNAGTSEFRICTICNKEQFHQLTINNGKKYWRWVNISTNHALYEEVL